MNDMGRKGMARGDKSAAVLKKAISEYCYPPVACDFAGGGKHLVFDCYMELEDYIRGQLSSEDPARVKDGLSNVLYWGYWSQPGRRKSNIGLFWQALKEKDGNAIQDTIDFIRWLRESGDSGCDPKDALLHLKGKKIPRFSGMGFLSKILMFLNPNRFVVLDSQIGRILSRAEWPGGRQLATYGEGKTVPATDDNAEIYAEWCNLCYRLASKVIADQELRAVDVERGFFRQVQCGDEERAAEILAAAG